MIIIFFNKRKHQSNMYISYLCHPLKIEIHIVNIVFKVLFQLFENQEYQSFINFTYENILLK